MTRPTPFHRLRSLLLACAAALVLLAGGSPLQAQSVAVMVNGEPITDYDIQQRGKLNFLTTRKQQPRQDTINELIDEKVNFETFFKRAKLNPNAHLITGVICGYRIEEIETPLTKQARYLDKLVDELAKGRKMEKILRQQ